MIQTTDKMCNACETIYPLNSDNFYRSSRSPDGFYYRCKTCDDANRKQRYESKSSHNINRICKNCEKFFYAELCRVKKGRSKFCGMRCKASYFRKINKLKLCNKGSRNPNSRLTESDVIEIRSALKNNESVIDIRNKYNISASHIANIKAGRIWKNID